MKMTCYIVKEFMDQYRDTAVAVTTELIFFVMQILMSVRLMTPTTVMKMQTVQTQRGVTTALVTLVTLEMESAVQVGHSSIIFNLISLRVQIECNYSLIIDINECDQEVHTCHSNAKCTDTVGSFNCTCREGFEGDGVNCTGKLLVHNLQCLCTERESMHGSSSLHDDLATTEYCRVGVSAHYQTNTSYITLSIQSH